MNVYKSRAKVHQVVYRSTVVKILISEILFWKYLEYVPLTTRNYKELKRTKIVIFTISSFLSVQYALVTTADNFQKNEEMSP